MKTHNEMVEMVVTMVLIKMRQTVSRRCCQYTNYVIPPDNGYNITDDLLAEVQDGDIVLMLLLLMLCVIT